MSPYRALMHPDTKMPIKCPIQKDSSCNNHCAWFDIPNHQCSVTTITKALSKLAEMSESEATPNVL